MAKPLRGSYQPDKRVMFKIKHQRTADCVVAGYRVHKSGPDSIGSLLLGLYNDDGELASVGVIGAFPAARRKELFTELQPLVTTFDDHPWAWAKQEEGARTPRNSEFSRWNNGKDLSFVPLRPELVVEVRYEHMEGVRFRHTAQFNRWRPDRDPRSCTYEQLEEPVKFDLADILPGALAGPRPSMTAASGVAEVNWSGTYTYRAGQVHRPRSVAELQDLVRAGGRLHALGTRHSFNGVADGGALVSVAGLGGSAVVDPEARTVTGAGRDALRRPGARPGARGLGPGQPGLAPPHLGGRIGGHRDPRSGNDNQSLASAVVGLTLVDGTGEAGPARPGLARPPWCGRRRWGRSAWWPR